MNPCLPHAQTLKPPLPILARTKQNFRIRLCVCVFWGVGGGERGVSGVAPVSVTSRRLASTFEWLTIDSWQVHDLSVGVWLSNTPAVQQNTSVGSASQSISHNNTARFRSRQDRFFRRLGISASEESCNYREEMIGTLKLSPYYTFPRFCSSYSLFTSRH